MTQNENYVVHSLDKINQEISLLKSQIKQLNDLRAIDIEKIKVLEQKLGIKSPEIGSSIKNPSNKKIKIKK